MQPQQQPYYQQNYFDESQTSFQPFVQTDNTPRNLEEPTLEELMRKMTDINTKFQEWTTEKIDIQKEEPRQMKEINMKYDQEWAANKITIQKEEPTLEELVRQMKEMNMKYDREWEAKKF